MFVGGMPRGPGRRLLSPLSQLLEEWGHRRATEVTVMTPFVGQSEEAQAKVIGRLMEVPRRSNAGSQLIVPGVPSERDPTVTVVSLPRWFRDRWATAWHQPIEDLTTWVIPCSRQDAGESVQRDLHAKAVVLTDEERVAMLCGSSNFSPHGMGVGVANVEANLCYIDAADSDVWRGLPVDWDRDRASTPPTWLEDPAPLEDDAEPTGPRLPGVFSWATFDQRAGTITIGFDAQSALPAEWSIGLAGGEAATVILVGNETLRAVPADGVWHRTLESLRQSVAITVLQVRWRVTVPGPGATALLPVHTTSGEALLPPEEFRSLTADAIIACLLSGRDPAELIAPSGFGDNRPGASRGSTDPLRFVDTSTYPMYKSRRLGRGLAMLGEQIVRTVRTSTAMSHRLRQDPLGPVNLAKAVTRDLTSGSGISSGSFDLAYGLFALAEIQLMLAYAGKRVQADRGPHEPDLRGIFVSAICDVEIERRSIRVTADAGGRERRTPYIDQVHVKCSELLGSPIPGHSSAT
jgi:hypothetical protein